MLRTFNLGCGLVLVCESSDAASTIAHLASRGHDCWQVGAAIEGTGDVLLEGAVQW